MEPGHLLHSTLTHPSSANVWCLKSRYPIVPAAQLISSSDNNMAVSILPPMLWWQQISWSYCAASQTFGLMAWHNLNKKVSLSCSQRVSRSIVVMLHIWYAIAFRFNSHLGDFPFLYFTFLKTLQTFPLGVRFRLALQLAYGFRVSFRVYLLCLLRFCQACCCRHLGGKIDFFLCACVSVLIFCCILWCPVKGRAPKQRSLVVEVRWHNQSRYNRYFAFSNENLTVVKIILLQKIILQLR